MQTDRPTSPVVEAVDDGAKQTYVMHARGKEKEGERHENPEENKKTQQISLA